jgi:hypothetical protein
MLGKHRFEPPANLIRIQMRPVLSDNEIDTTIGLLANSTALGKLARGAAHAGGAEPSSRTASRRGRGVPPAGLDFGFRAGCGVAVARSGSSAAAGRNASIRNSVISNAERQSAQAARSRRPCSAIW